MRHNLLQLLYSRTEDIFVLCTGFLSNLNVSAVQCAERYCAVEHKLHIACTRRFCTRRGDLLGNISRSHQLFRIGNTVIAHKYHSQQILCIRVGVYELCYLVNKLDNAFCTVISGCGLCTENKCSGGEISEISVLDFIVKIQYRECVQKLTLVFVQTLDLNIKNGFRVDFNSLRFLDKVGKLPLLSVLYIYKAAKHTLIVRILLKAA